MNDGGKQCWLMKGCPSRTGACYSCVPDGDECPIWRWFKEQIVIQCKDCKHSSMYCTEDTNGDWLYECCHPSTDDNPVIHKWNWFCADGERRKEND